MPLGRIARMCADFLRGKHKPNYVARKMGEHSDYCVIVNAADQYMTGRKAQQKVYRKYTGYVGNLQTVSMKHVLEKTPERVLETAIRGMIPKNRLREDTLSRKLFIYPGPFHPHFKQGLPQFTEQERYDVNEDFNFGKVQERRHEYKVIYESDPNDLPEEFADVERDIDTDLDLPWVLQKKTTTNPKSNMLQAKALKKSYRFLAKYKKHKI